MFTCVSSHFLCYCYLSGPSLLIPLSWNLFLLPQVTDFTPECCLRTLHVIIKMTCICVCASLLLSTHHTSVNEEMVFPLPENSWHHPPSPILTFTQPNLPNGSTCREHSSEKFSLTSQARLSDCLCCHGNDSSSIMKVRSLHSSAQGLPKTPHFSQSKPQNPGIIFCRALQGLPLSSLCLWLHLLLLSPFSKLWHTTTLGPWK